MLLRRSWVACCVCRGSGMRGCSFCSRPGGRSSSGRSRGRAVAGEVGGRAWGKVAWMGGQAVPAAMTAAAAMAQAEVLREKRQGRLSCLAWRKRWHSGLTRRSRRNIPGLKAGTHAGGRMPRDGAAALVEASSETVTGD